MNWLITLQTVREVVLILTALTGAIVAISGLRIWKSQLKGKTEYDLARRLLKAVYRVRESIRIIRAPYMTNSEIIRALKEEGYSEEDFNEKIESVESEIAVYNSRYKIMNEALSELRIELLEAEVHWGNEIHDRIKPLYDCLAKLRVNINRWIRFQKQEKERSRSRITPEEMEKIDEVLYETSQNPEEDSFTAEVQNAVEKFEIFVKPYLAL